MEKLSYEKGQTNLKKQDKQETEQLATVEELREQREKLERRVAVTKKQKEDSIMRQLEDREGIIAEDTKLVSLLEEAGENLKYFETQNQQGLLADQEDIVELENLRTLVASLQEQRNATLQKYEAITSNPEIYEKVWEEAYGEKMSKELKEKREGAEKEIQDRVSEIVSAIEQLSSQMDLACGNLEAKGSALNSAKEVLIKVVKEACESLGSGGYKTSNFLKDSEMFPSYGEYFTKIEQYRKSLGLFKGKEKAAIDRVLQKKHKFSEADKKSEEYHEAHQYLETVNAKVDELAEQYKTLLMEAWAKENEIKKEFPTEGNIAGNLPNKVYFGIRHDLERRSGLGKIEDGRWVPSYEFGRKEGADKQKEKKFIKLNNLFQRIEKKAGQHLWINNPGK